MDHSDKTSSQASPGQLRKRNPAVDSADLLLQTSADFDVPTGPTDNNTLLQLQETTSAPRIIPATSNALPTSALEGPTKILHQPVAPGEKPDSTSLLCPRCMRHVKHFREQERGTELQYVCPECSETVPFRYVRDYHSVSRIKLSLAGMSGHGKTMFLRGIYSQLTNIGRKWEQFHFAPLSDDDSRMFHSAIGDSNRGELANPSQLAERPVSFELNGIPGAGNLHLLMYDISGEAFDSAASIGRNAFFIPGSEVITFILSLSDVDSESSPAFLLSRLTDVLKFKGQDPATKSLVVVLSKGDRLRAAPNLPASAEFFLSNEVTPDPCELGDMEVLSLELENWLTTHPDNYWNFVRTAKKSFLNVRFTVVSSLGSDPGPAGALVQLNPRNIVSPLLWLMRFTLPAIRLQLDSREQLYYDLSAAFEAAAAGNQSRASISLDPGVYRLKKTITVTSQVDMTGAGADLTQIIVQPGQADFRVIGGDFCATGISFVGDGGTLGCVFSITDAKFEFSKCRFSGDNQKVAAKPARDGVLVAGNAAGKITECIFTSIAGHGLLVEGEADVSVTGCEAYGNRECGMRFAGNSKVIARANVSHHNQHGITATNRAWVRLFENNCSENDSVGISIDENVHAALSSNKCHKNLIGIQIAKTANVTSAGPYGDCSFNRQKGLRDLRSRSLWVWISAIAVCFAVGVTMLTFSHANSKPAIDSELPASRSYRTIVRPTGPVETEAVPPQESVQTDSDRNRMNSTLRSKTQIPNATSNHKNSIVAVPKVERAPALRDNSTQPSTRTQPPDIQQTSDSTISGNASSSRERSNNKNDEASQLCIEKRYHDARGVYESAIQLDVSNARPLMNLARLLATCPDASVRNGKKAVELATRGNSLSAQRQWAYLAIVAASYAEAGDFDEAIRWGLTAQKEAAGADAGLMEVNLNLLRKRQPCRWNTAK
jgi:hypothetical protein